jgi:plastocyanin
LPCSESRRIPSLNGNIRSSTTVSINEDDLTNSSNESKTIERHNIMFSSPPYIRTKCISVLSPFLRLLTTDTLALFMFVTLALLMTTRGEESKTRRSTPIKVPKGEIIIDNLSFSPDTLRLPPVLKVTWIARDYVPQAVASADNQFKKSAVLKTGQSIFRTFATTGTYSFLCSIHPHTTGEIIIK